MTAEMISESTSIVRWIHSRSAVVSVGPVNSCGNERTPIIRRCWILAPTDLLVTAMDVVDSLLGGILQLLVGCCAELRTEMMIWIPHGRYQVKQFLSCRERFI
jgi:hypothetical protein